MKKKIYYQEQYMGQDINCGSSRPCYLNILEKLFERIQISVSCYTRPIGFHVRYRISETVDARSITDRINKHYSLKNSHRKQENTFSPIWVKATENDPNQDGRHYHLALILDGKKATKTSLHVLFSELVKSDLIDNYKIISHDNPDHKGGVNLKCEKGREDYFYWLSYIAKVRTKHGIDKTFSTNKIKKAG